MKHGSWSYKMNVVFQSNRIGFVKWQTILAIYWMTLVHIRKHPHTKIISDSAPHGIGMELIGGTICAGGWNLHEIWNEPAHEIMVLITWAISEGLGKPVHPRSLARAFAVRTHEVWKYTKGQTKNETSSHTGWLRMRVWRMSLRRTESSIHVISWAGSNIAFNIVIRSLIKHWFPALSKGRSKIFGLGFKLPDGVSNWLMYPTFFFFFFNFPMKVK